MIKRFRFALLTISFALLTFIFSLVSLSQPTHASVNDFKIESFKADYYLSRNEIKTSILKVEEELIAIFPEYDQNHGILRAIPKSYQNHTVSLDNITVTDEKNEPLIFSKSNKNDNVIIKIGDPNIYVRGRNTYKISYTLKNVINFQNLDEFYWDINGDQWDQPFGLVQSTLHLSADLANQLSGDLACYSGVFGSKEKNCYIFKTNINDVRITTSAYNLRPRENLSQVIGFKKGTFNPGPEIEEEKRQRKADVIKVIVGILFLPLITFVILFNKWRESGMDPKGKGVIIPEYVAPKGFNTITSDFVLNQKVTPVAISATIIELAVNGYLRIIETEKEEGLFKIKQKKYSIEIIKDPKDLAKEQREVLNRLFTSVHKVGDNVSISSPKPELYKIFDSLNEDIAAELTTKGYFIGDPHKIRNKYNIYAVLILMTGFILLFIPIIGMSLILSAVIAFIFSNIMPVRSQDGVNTRDYLLGLKHYINMAEKDRLKYLQSPEGAERIPINIKNNEQAIKLFENLLPYAVLFSLEEEWVKQFKNLYTQNPNWYIGSTSTFNSVNFVNSISTFSSISSASFAPPSSSGSSGFGGSSGSGGGGGGGGGGGW